MIGETFFNNTFNIFSEPNEFIFLIFSFFTDVNTVKFTFINYFHEKEWICFISFPIYF
jgi:hypothetical protein